MGLFVALKPGGSSSSYVELLGMNAQVHTPVDATTYYLGRTGCQTAGSTTEGTSKIFVPVAGTVVGAALQISTGGTLGSAEQGTANLRLNATTDTLISSAVQFDQRIQRYATGALNIPVVAGDYFEFKILTPTWVTNPTQVEYICTILIRV